MLLLVLNDYYCTVNYRTIRMENSIRRRHLLANLQPTTNDCLSSPLAFLYRKNKQITIMKRLIFDLLAETRRIPHNCL